MTIYHKCGHPAAPQRFLNVEKIARVLCDPCRAAFSTENEAARIESERRGLLPLRGNSPRQIAWATSIRLEMLVRLEKTLAEKERITVEDGRRLVEMRTVRSAAWWIRKRPR